MPPSATGYGRAVGAPTVSVGPRNDREASVIADDVIIGAGVEIPHPDLVNLYGCRVGEGSRIGPFVEIQRGVVVGRNCKISSHAFLCTGVTIGDGVFVGHGVMFTNDTYPAAVDADGNLLEEDGWELKTTTVRDRVSIGSNATILPGVTINEGALVGAGAVVTRDIAPWTVVVGNPARPLPGTSQPHPGS